MSTSKVLRHFITAPRAFPKASSLEFNLVMVATFYTSKIQLKYISGLA